MKHTKDAHKSLVGKPEEKSPLETLTVERRIMLK
jgi:hypothetical protein